MNQSSIELRQPELWPNSEPQMMESTSPPAIGNTNVSRSSLIVYVLTLSKTFMSTHPKAGMPTNFFVKIKQGEKIHTIRGNYELWQRRIKKINEGKAILSIREWSGKPYKSKQIELMQLQNVGLQKIERDRMLGWFIDDVDSDCTSKKIARNDGLSLEDFAAWFKTNKNYEPMAIIHFTNFRY